MNSASGPDRIQGRKKEFLEIVLDNYGHPGFP